MKEDEQCSTKEYAYHVSPHLMIWFIVDLYSLSTFISAVKKVRLFLPWFGGIWQQQQKSQDK